MKTSQSKAGTAAIAAPSKAVAEQYMLIAEMQRPRSVRMTRQGKLSVATMAIALLVFAGVLVVMAAIQSPGANVTRFPRIPRPVAYVLPIGIVAFVAFMAQRALDRQWQLLTNGQLTMARVTKHLDTSKGRRIYYEFTSPAGETISRVTMDNSRQLLESMTVPVFYDPQNPKKHVPLCASFYEIVLSGQK